MDRVSRTVALFSLGLLVTAAGCRSTRPEVPPGRPYTNDGRQRPAIGFSTDPHPIDGAALTNIVPDSPGAGRLGQGTGLGSSRPDSPSALGGGLGSNASLGAGGMNEPTSAANSGHSNLQSDDSVRPVGAPVMPRPSINPNPAPTLDPATLPADAAPLPDISAPSNQVVQPVLENTGKMGQGTDLPSPN